MKIRLESTDAPTRTTVSDTDGSFIFSNLLGGYYTVTVEAGDEFETTRESVNIDRETSKGTQRIVNVIIQLRLKGGRAGNSFGVVEAGLVGVPKPAAELYTKALKAAQKGESEKAVEHLNGALAQHPQFALALSELSAQYLKLGQAEKAAVAARAALNMTPNDFNARLTLGIALLNLKQFAEAEKELREAIKKNDSAATAHMYLGMALLYQNQHDEAEKELQRAIGLQGGENLAQAHKYLGGLYWRRHEYKLAADELEKYVKLSPKAADAERIRATIKELRGKK